MMPIHVRVTYNIPPKLIEELMIDEGVDYSKMCTVLKRLGEVINRDKLRQVNTEDIKTISSKDWLCKFADGAGCTSGNSSNNGSISKGGSRK